MKKTMVELFAGVGGFRLAFDRLNSGWDTVWFSQWEPSKKAQDAYDCYVRHFGLSEDLTGNTATSNTDIAAVDKSDIPDHTLLVGGFPCQDYSVARSLSGEKGITGKKGVLWWQIRETIETKKPTFCLFENVDRLLKSPSTQRGRDFGVMLSCLNALGYSVEWRVVNAALYGAAQRRRRVFIFAFRNDSDYARSLFCSAGAESVLTSQGVFAKAFPIEQDISITTTQLDDDVADVSDKFGFNFRHAGYMHGGIVYTTDITEIQEAPITLGSILEHNVPERYYITDDKMPKWEYLKGGKKIPRTAANGHEYIYSEGPVAFPDNLDAPARTMLTSEGTVNRSSHAVKDPETGRVRIITPLEAERIQGFDDNWTEGMPDRMRYFCMGNALVVPMITRVARVIDSIVEQ